MAALYLGTARARLGPAAALIDVARGAIAACEENRLTRAVDSGTAGPPELSIDELLRFLGCSRADIAQSLGVGDEGNVDPSCAHAEYARSASGFDESLVFVCGRETSAWIGASPIPLQRHSSITEEYGRLTARLGLRPTRDEHLAEALARGGHEEAAAVQRRLGDDLLTMLGELQTQTKAQRVCLSGGLFFNTYFTTLVASSRIFEETYVPPHPGRNGAALGAALLGVSGASGASGGAGSAGAGAAGSAGDVWRKLGGMPWPTKADAIGSPYLGPSYTDQEIKGTLENCKLSFDLLHDDRLFELVLHQLSRGRLVGWYHGRLEWGPRALGHRSVLADPFAPHVLENLNGFLKRRPAFRAYGVSVPVARLSDLFAGASSASPFMQFEYRPRDLDRFRTILPPGVQTLRVHTVDETEPRTLRLLEMWGEKSGMPVLVNTSFNGFHEPLVCSPRDAIRVFYGTGLDVLALENFLLRK
ncbi:MAG TPA: carbamoyltransferase C-terminal domain-containing protein [Vicinamibacterales bacterium]|nr:carbamoyltransferase C-terminal domain-containing protein [Vicinamibacterales bacterium]